MAAIKPSQGRRPLITFTRDQIDVTSNHRPDPTWRFTDSAGHEHRWWEWDRKRDTNRPAENYNPALRYHTPTIRWIETAAATDEYPAEGYHVCRECGDKVRPGYCPDAIDQFIPGQAHLYVDGVEVKKEEMLEVIRLYYPEEYDPRMFDNL